MIHLAMHHAAIVDDAVLHNRKTARYTQQAGSGYVWKMRQFVIVQIELRGVLGATCPYMLPTDFELYLHRASSLQMDTRTILYQSLSKERNQVFTKVPYDDAGLSFIFDQV